MNYYLTVLGVRSPKLKAKFHLEALRKNLFPRHFWLLETAYIPWLMAHFSHFQNQQLCISSSLSDLCSVVIFSYFDSLL